MAPYYMFIGRIVARSRPWEIREVTLNRKGPGGGAELRLVGIVRRLPEQPAPAIQAESGLNVGAIIQLPVVFWSLLIAWQADSVRHRLKRIVIGLPLFLMLETGTTVCQLIGPMAEASAYLNGNYHPVTSWELWSRFLEAGGRPVVAVVAALITIAIPVRDR
jgi:hypothetical protein